MKPARTDNFNRRSFLQTACAASACSLIPMQGAISAAGLYEVLPEAKVYLHPAQYYEKLEKRRVRCTLCPRKCEVDDQERGYCGVRENRDGDYFTLVYGRPCTLHVDPVEKKPLFHFLPGTEIFSLATVGCNVNCKFCQNWQISQVRPEQERSYDAPPDKLVETALNSQTPAIAHTYTEPVIFYEYAKEIGKIAHEKGLKNTFISNGYIEEKPLKELLPFLDAVKIDLKAFTERFYQELVVGELQPVLRCLEILVEEGMWTEIVYLVIPTQNDDPDEIGQMCRWIRSNLGSDVPLHFTRFHPQYMLKTLPPTPIKTLERCHSIAREEGLNYVYIGNVASNKAEHTYCASCGEILIRRSGYRVNIEKLDKGNCLNCGISIPGIWE
ncbi:AmmeMemoRadiSam system radical SAM enzyme [candidate division LCP-89 bacterium B3_LCP]|uniref:AmmeMemoRadiSam system radical SAM enzyme n=1 Tax=candidate division LCP-89 bacterium B3_LCP TaxID=2012998 RepID=A0A532UZZ1_UNCL8|nr:MAG: AmmeMemoRadiSam system radical SAM enzyme [candidate division LCP-89 bacterium B3_LCP]